MGNVVLIYSYFDYKPLALILSIIDDLYPWVPPDILFLVARHCLYHFSSGGPVLVSFYREIPVSLLACYRMCDVYHDLVSFCIDLPTLQWLVIRSVMKEMILSRL